MNSAYLLFEIKENNMQVFWYPSQEDIVFNKKPKDVYWQNTFTRVTYGPFPSIYLAMTHFTETIAQEKQAPVDNVVYVDFITKKRRVPNKTIGGV